MVVLQLASQPITLTVGGNTSLALSVSRDKSSSNHIVSGRLTSGATAVGVIAAFGFTSALVSSLFDILFPGRDIIFQMPFLAISNIIGLLVMALTIRNEGFKKWRKDLGW